MRLYSARVRGDAWICAATLGLTDSWLQIGLCSEGRDIDGYVIAEMNFKFKSDENNQVQQHRKVDIIAKRLGRCHEQLGHILCVDGDMQ